MITRKILTTAAAVGSAGVATGTITSTDYINGTIRAIYVAYLGSPPGATTDLTIAGASTPAIPILTITNAATDAWFYPMAQAQNTAAATITNQGAPVVVDDRIVVTMAQANAADYATVTILYETD